MTRLALAVAVGGLLGAAHLPWSFGARARLAAVGRPPGAPRPHGRVVDDRGARLRVLVDRLDRDGGADVVLLLDLVDVAVGAGAGVPRALEAVGGAVGGAAGDELAAVALALLLGTPWHEAWDTAPALLAPLGECLEAAWVHGAAPGPALRSRAGAIRRQRRRAAREAAGRLGVHLVLPLGLCFLPAFILLGLVPVVVSLAHGLVG